MAAIEPSVAAVGVPVAERPRVSIVPVRGLPIVAAVLAGLVVTIAGNWLWALDFYHVVGGGIWTALDLFMGFVIGPIMRSLPVPARIELTKRLMPKMLLILPTLVTMTLGAGFQLARYNGMLAGGYPRHGWVVASMVVVAVMAVVALALLQPANIAVLFELGKPQPNPAVIQTLMRRYIYAAAVTGAMQVATLLIMTRLAT
ncbi:MAG TPA: hypothetical protein VJQ07_06180 [Gaiellaceae bacterium]|nr:hypothetical protein [Gaiellaceae bacterium]